jgi:hypothetical protein
MSNIARFRADPSKVRVSIRPCGKKWTAKVSGFSGKAHYVVDETNADP